MSPASYLTAPPRVARRSIARLFCDQLARSEACGSERQPVGRADRSERSLRTDLPPEHLPGVGMQRVEVLPVGAERLVADARLTVDGRRGDGLAQLDAAVVAD